MVDVIGKHWRRNESGQWEEFGSIPPGHKRFQLQATEVTNGVRAFGNYDLKEAEDKVATFIQKNAPNYTHYGIIPVQGEPMSEETKAALKASRKSKKAAEKAENAANTAAQPGEAAPADGAAPAPKPKKEKKAKEPKAPKPKKEKPPKVEKPKLPDWTPIEVPKSAPDEAHPEGKRLSREAVFATETWQNAFKLYWEQKRGPETCPNGHDLTNQENVGVAALLWDGVARCQPCWKKCNDEYLAGLKAKKAAPAA